MHCLVVIDVQNDFVTEALGTKEAQKIVPNLVKKVANFEGEVIFTQDTHSQNYLDTQEGKKLPVEHCIAHTEGWRIIPELEKIQKEKNLKVYTKPCFGSLVLASDLKKLYQAGKLESVELVGLCTDICVISNALLLKSNMPELPIKVDSKCCAGVTKAKHLAALETMRSCQIEVL